MRVNDLRACGVTIHLYVSYANELGSARNMSDNRRRNINTTRHTIPDVPVIYLVGKCSLLPPALPTTNCSGEPTAANLSSIGSDLTRGLYSPAYVNFLSSIPRPLLENFAEQIATTETAEHISQVFDQYLNFITSEPDLFSLGMGKETYRIMNSAHTTDEQLDNHVDRIVSGLFSVVVTMGACSTLNLHENISIVD
jgi:hypothetical protein